MDHSICCTPFCINATLYRIRTPHKEKEAPLCWICYVRLCALYPAPLPNDPEAVIRMWEEAPLKARRVTPRPLITFGLCMVPGCESRGHHWCGILAICQPHYLKWRSDRRTRDLDELSLAETLEAFYAEVRFLASDEDAAAASQAETPRFVHAAWERDGADMFRRRSPDGSVRAAILYDTTAASWDVYASDDPHGKPLPAATMSGLEKTSDSQTLSPLKRAMLQVETGLSLAGFVVRREISSRSRGVFEAHRRSKAKNGSTSIAAPASPATPSSCFVSGFTADRKRWAAAVADVLGLLVPVTKQTQKLQDAVDAIRRYDINSFQWHSNTLSNAAPSKRGSLDEETEAATLLCLLLLAAESDNPSWAPTTLSSIWIRLRQGAAASGGSRPAFDVAVAFQDAWDRASAS